MDFVQYWHALDPPENASSILILFSICLLTSSRYARIHRLGIKNLQTDDYLMVLVGVSRQALE
jgi:hypothetical protein